MKIRLAGIVNESVVDGPGIRMAVFTQGCPHHCAGCQNPETHDFMGGYLADTDEILKPMANRKYIKGLTVSGGEPLCQVQAVAELAKKTKAMGKDVVIYTGYLVEELLEKAKEDANIVELLQNTDYLIDGPFIESQKSLHLVFRGSVNQRVIDIPKTLSAGKVVLC
jgi:anaerobic ribonucleoside-triphosphate reductase activating protein